LKTCSAFISVSFSRGRKYVIFERICFSQKPNLDGLKNPIPLSFVPKNEQPPTHPHFPRASLHLTLLLKNKTKKYICTKILKKPYFSFLKSNI
jgi:hypothetical protein